MGRPNKLTEKETTILQNKIMEIINTVDISKKIEIMVEAKASMILLASVNRDTISPVRRVAKKDTGR